MKHYEVTWTYETDAQTPEEAARNMQEAMLLGVASVFEVAEVDPSNDTVGESEWVDLA